VTSLGGQAGTRSGFRCHSLVFRRTAFGALFAMACQLLSACAGSGPRPDRGIGQSPSVDSRGEDSADTPEAALAKWRQLVAPYVSEARKTFPEARRQFVAARSPGATFLVIVLLRDGDGHFQMSFMSVEGVDAGTITGRISSEPSIVHGFHLNDGYRVAQTEILDWLVTMADGSEKGNFVGRFESTLPRDVQCRMARDLTSFPTNDGAASSGPIRPCGVGQ